MPFRVIVRIAFATTSALAVHIARAITEDVPFAWVTASTRLRRNGPRMSIFVADCPTLENPQTPHYHGNERSNVARAARGWHFSRHELIRSGKSPASGKDSRRTLQARESAYGARALRAAKRQPHPDSRSAAPPVGRRFGRSPTAPVDHRQFIRQGRTGGNLPVENRAGKFRCAACGESFRSTGLAKHSTTPGGKSSACVIASLILIGRTLRCWPIR